MPGPYTHISVVEELVKSTALDELGLEKKDKETLKKWASYMKMGAISPDYPYLNIELINWFDEPAADYWGNTMHHKYEEAIKDNIIHVGIEEISNLKDNESKYKYLAWFLGYMSHLVADGTCHPVTNQLVGDYDAGNKTEHRVSEMHQDAYIFYETFDKKLTREEHLKEVAQEFSNEGSGDTIDKDIEQFWRNLLSKAYPHMFSKYRLNLNEWHDCATTAIDNFAEEGSIIPSRHLKDFIVDEGCAYPSYETIDKEKYINMLPNPKDPKEKIEYKEVFTKAVNNTKNYWKLAIQGALYDDKEYLDKIEIWSLDTGKRVEVNKIMWV